MNDNQCPASRPISGASWHGQKRKLVALANAAHAFEHQFDVELDVGDALRHVGPVHLEYWANGDDDGVIATFANSGDRYWFNEPSYSFEII